MLRDEAIGVEASWRGVEREAGHEQRCEQVHRTLRNIVKARGALDAREAEALREAERLRVWRQYGYSSLLEYLEIEMGYPPRAGIERLRVANAIVELPAIAEALAEGELSYSAGRELTRVATADTEGQWLDAAKDKNLRQIEELVSGHKRGDKPTDPPDPKLRKRSLRYHDIDEETFALMRQARQIVERELGERIDDDAFLRIVARTIVDGARPAQRTHAPYQIAVTVCAECKRGSQDGGGITVEMSPARLETALCDAQHIGRVDRACTDDDEPAAPSSACAAVDGPAAPLSACTAVDGPAAPSSACTDDDEPAAPSSACADDIDVAAVRERREPVASSAQGHRPSARAKRDVGRPLAAAFGDSSRAKPDRGSTGATPHSGSSRALAESGSPRALTERGSTRGMPDHGSARGMPDHGSARAKSIIPPALRRKVNARDHGRCRVPWCRSSRNIDQHHLQPVSQGGQHTLENLVTLCESHHLAHHQGSLEITGTASNATFARRAQSSFAIAERSVETGLALKALGFDKHEVKAALEKTRTHVGTTELTLEQWIKVALSYCPKPRSRC